jgi:hypothetical protein
MENQLEQEQEYIVNRLQKRLEAVEGDKAYVAGLRAGSQAPCACSAPCCVAVCRAKCGRGFPKRILYFVLLFWHSIPSGLLAVFEKPNRSSFTFTLQYQCCVFPTPRDPFFPGQVFASQAAGRDL